MSYLYAAEAYLSLNQVDEAKVIYEMILKVYPDDPAAFYAQDGLAWCHTYKGEDQLALEARQKLKDMLSVANSSFSFAGLNELGIADSMFNQKNYEDAYQLYSKFVAENPQSPDAPAAPVSRGDELLSPELLHAGDRPLEEIDRRVPEREGLGAGAGADRRHLVPRAEVPGRHRGLPRAHRRGP